MENNPKAKCKEFAKRLQAYEATKARVAGATASPAFRVCEELRRPLGRLMGAAGFGALFSRALALAGAEVPSLRGLHVEADGSLQNLEEMEAKVDKDEMAEGEIAVVAQLLDLLVTFIGPTLTLGLLRDIWPEIEDLNF